VVAPVFFQEPLLGKFCDECPAGVADSGVRVGERDVRSPVGSIAEFNHQGRDAGFRGNDDEFYQPGRFVVDPHCPDAGLAAGISSAEYASLLGHPRLGVEDFGLPVAQVLGLPHRAKEGEDDVAGSADSENVRSRDSIGSLFSIFGLSAVLSDHIDVSVEASVNSRVEHA